ncbi:MAG: hypothetical protein HY720_15200 [Planctomycetes bacterium]|nr:hypothetical protein [Planctomycetota bacterium]
MNGPRFPGLARRSWKVAFHALASLSLFGPVSAGQDGWLEEHLSELAVVVGTAVAYEESPAEPRWQGDESVQAKLKLRVDEVLWCEGARPEGTLDLRYVRAEAVPNVWEAGTSGAAFLRREGEAWTLVVSSAKLVSREDALRMVRDAREMQILQTAEPVEFPLPAEGEARSEAARAAWSRCRPGFDELRVLRLVSSDRPRARAWAVAILDEAKGSPQAILALYHLAADETTVKVAGADGEATRSIREMAREALGRPPVAQYHRVSALIRGLEKLQALQKGMRPGTRSVQGALDAGRIRAGLAEAAGFDAGESIEAWKEFWFGSPGTRAVDLGPSPLDPVVSLVRQADLVGLFRIARATDKVTPDGDTDCHEFRIALEPREILLGEASGEIVVYYSCRVFRPCPVPPAPSFEGPDRIESAVLFLAREGEGYQLLNNFFWNPLAGLNVEPLDAARQALAVSRALDTLERADRVETGSGSALADAFAVLDAKTETYGKGSSLGSFLALARNRENAAARAWAALGLAGLVDDPRALAALECLAADDAPVEGASSVVAGATSVRDIAAARIPAGIGRAREIDALLLVLQPPAEIGVEPERAAFRLKELTGIDLGTDSSAWCEWWRGAPPPK